MTEADEKHEGLEEQKPGKQGLHGWKAALAMFGCGSLAAFGVFGLMAGALSLFLDSLSSGVDSEENVGGAPPQEASPEEELHPDEINLCEDYFEHVSYVNVTDVVSASFENDADESSLINAGDLWVASGECEFIINPQYGESASWEFSLDFDVVIQDPEMDRDERAQAALEERVGEVSSDPGSSYVVNEHDWTSDEWPGSATSFYHEGGDGEESRYVVVAQTRSALYQIEFTGDPRSEGDQDVPEFDFERQARDVVGRVDGRFGVRIPE